MATHAVGNEVWVLGSTGRSGREVAAQLVRRGISPVLVGRDSARLADVAAQVGNATTLVSASLDEAAEQIRRRQPAVVINTVGPFAATAMPLVRACLPTTHYVDLANDISAISALLEVDGEAAATGRTLVSGAGFGVAATESIVVRLCRQRPPAASVRVDMVPSIGIEQGTVGEALAATLIDGVAGVRRGRREDARPARLGSAVRSLTLPDGARVRTASMPLGEFVAARRASGAPSVISASSEAPTSLPVRALLPLGTALLRIPALRAFATRRLAQVRLRARERPREHSWGHAHVRWPDGTTREGWLRLGDAQIFTGAVAAEVAHRLLTGKGRPGAHTPAALFGPSLVEACGGEYVIGDRPAETPSP